MSSNQRAISAGARGLHDSVDDLINYYKSTDMSVTKRSEAKLKSAVNWHGFYRQNCVGSDTFDLTHGDVNIGKTLGKFNGNGNFGEVKLGTIVAPGVSCAVKTCKDTVPDPGRFLEEADAPKNYDHPNIVCTDLNVLFHRVYDRVIPCIPKLPSRNPGIISYDCQHDTYIPLQHHIIKQTNYQHHHHQQQNTNTNNNNNNKIIEMKLWNHMDAQLTQTIMI